jgi:hypothetical protein
MQISKRALVIIAAIASGALWIEHRNRITMKAPTPVEIAGRTAPVCPVNESVPFNRECLAFISGSLPDRPKIRDMDMSADSPELP